MEFLVVVENRVEEVALVTPESVAYGSALPQHILTAVAEITIHIQ